MSPDVTVVVTTHDRRALLAEAIASVRAQEGVDWELIVADDGSTDGTGDWLEDELHPPAERWIANPASGRPHTANAALPLARGRHLLFLDDDDTLLPGALAALSAALDRSPGTSAAVGARVRVVGGQARRIDHPARAQVSDAALPLFGLWGAIPGQFMMPAQIARELGGFPDAFPTDDRALLLALASRGPFAIVPDCAVQYRIHPGQHTNPPGIEALRRRVIAESLPRFAPERRRGAGAAWAAGRRRWRADDHREQGRHGRALALYLGAALTSPAYSRSPLIWPSLAHNSLTCARRMLRV